MSTSIAARVKGLLAVALAVAGVCAGVPAGAQVRVGEDGRAADANSRVGSGGYNTPRRNATILTPNDIAVGNVTGGQEFRGTITRDPTQPFGGRSGLASDRFLRRATPQVSTDAPNRPAGLVATPFYSTTPVGNAPNGFALNPYTGQYQPISRVTRGAEDIQFGVPPGTPVIRPSADGGEQLVLPTTMRDENGAYSPMLMTATPLLGVRPMPTLADEDRFLAARSTDLRRPGEPPLDVATLRRLREELRQTMLSGDAVSAQRARELDAKARELQDGQTSPLIRQSERDAAATTPLLSGTPEAAAAAAKARDLDPADRNPMLMQLREAERARQAARNAKPNPATPSAPPSLSTPPSPSTPPADAGATTRAALSGLRTDLVPATNPATLGVVQPIAVGSLAEAQKEQGLKELLEGAEKLVAAGRYASAVDRYGVALRYSPGDATMLVARAHAELGAGFFARAEGTLRRAVATDPSVLNARYDLRKSLGDARVDTLVNDLKRIATEDPRSATPVVLLGYLAYNGGDSARAGQLLDEAASRAGDDELVAQMRERWSGAGGNK